MLAIDEAIVKGGVGRPMYIHKGVLVLFSVKFYDFCLPIYQ
jgi:hypothetical protein